MVSVWKLMLDMLQGRRLVPSVNGKSALAVAVERDNTLVTQELLKRHARSVNEQVQIDELHRYRSETGPLLLCAIHFGNLQITHLLLDNGELLKAGEAAGFDVMITSDQNIGYQQNLRGRRLALLVLGSNIWPVVRDHGATIAAKVETSTPGSYDFIEMPVPANRRRRE